MEAIQQQIETLMAGKDNFIISLKKPTDQNYQGAIAQSGSKKNEFEVYPECDQIKFSTKKDVTNVTYTRVYSDWPSSVSTFALSDIESVILKQ